MVMMTVSILFCYCLYFRPSFFYLSLSTSISLLSKSWTYLNEWYLTAPPDMAAEQVRSTTPGIKSTKVTKVSSFIWESEMWMSSAWKVPRFKNNTIAMMMAFCWVECANLLINWRLVEHEIHFMSVCWLKRWFNDNYIKFMATLLVKSNIKLEVFKCFTFILHLTIDIDGTMCWNLLSWLMNQVLFCNPLRSTLLLMYYWMVRAWAR